MITAMHLQKEKSILEAFWSWLENQHPVRNSQMDKAVQDVVNQKPYLEEKKSLFHCHNLAIRLRLVPHDMKSLFQL